jgi:cation:H+ antiporter
LTFLAVATLYSFTIPIKGHLSLLDTAILVSLFGAYIFFASRRPTEEPELLGPAKLIGSLPMVTRRIFLFLLFAYAGSAIFASAEPFAEGLIEIGEEFGISQFLLVQWLAPLASESPEFIIASLFVLRGRAGPAMGALISSKVNQWTLLIGSLPLAFAISGGSLTPLHFDSRQSEEILLTAAQSAFAVTVFLSLSISRWEAFLLAALFGTQLFFTDTTVRLVYSFVYITLAVGMLFLQRNEIMPLINSAREAARRGAPMGRAHISHEADEEGPEEMMPEEVEAEEQPTDGRRTGS